LEIPFVTSADLLVSQDKTSSCLPTTKNCQDQITSVPLYLPTYCQGSKANLYCYTPPLIKKGKSIVTGNEPLDLMTSNKPSNITFRTPVFFKSEN
jgi:hypothetical protein